MALRWRTDGRLLCAAKYPEMEGDTYIDDRLHYRLSVEAHAILPSHNEKTSGRWYWICEYPCITGLSAIDIWEGVYEEGGQDG